MSSADLELRTGEIIASKYRVERVLGMGAMGVVVSAMHVDLGERRALKILRPQLASNAEAVERFLREARAAARLKSQHVARVHDVGRLPSGAPYLVMEHLEGTDLKALLAARARLPADEATRYLLQACEAIAEAHQSGIVHRDLKPANLFLTRGPGGAPLVKVLDFGIAKVRTPEGGGDITGGESLLGTPLYMSPEQMRGASSVDGRSDLWSLGAILYELTTGELPFTGGSVTAICAAVIADPPRRPRDLVPGLTPAFEAIVLKCLQKKAADRYESVSELVAALRPFAAMAPGAPPPRSPSIPPSSPLERPSSPLERPSSPLERPSAAPGVSAAASTVGHSTAHASTWTGAAEKAPAPKASRRGPYAAVALIALAGAGALAFALTRAPKKSPKKAPAQATEQLASSEALPTADPRSITAPEVIATAPSASPSASPAPSVASASVPSASSTPSSARSAAPPPPRVGSPPPPPPPPFIPTLPPVRPPDAFGADRK